MLSIPRGAGGSRSYVFRLDRCPPPAGPPGAASAAAIAALDAASGALGRLEIRWRGAMGESGRLQTQQLLGAAQHRRDVTVTLLQAGPASSHACSVPCPV